MAFLTIEMELMVILNNEKNEYFELWAYEAYMCENYLGHSYIYIYIYILGWV